jgi:FMN reductase (NADPH)
MSENKRPRKGFIRSLVRIIRTEPDIPETLTDNKLLQVIMGRRSIRAFTSEPIPEDIIAALLEAGRMAPSGVNLQTWTFIRFSLESWRDIFNRPIPFGGQLAIMVLSDLHRLRLLMEEVDFPDEPLTLHSLAVFDAGLAAMNITIAAEACGLSSIMLSETGQTGLLDVGILRESLSLPDSVVPLTTIVCGYTNRKFAPVPPRLPMRMISGEGEYPEVDREKLSLWLGDMKAGYKAMRPWSSFKAQMKSYKRKIHQAEEDLIKVVFPQSSEK